MIPRLLALLSLIIFVLAGNYGMAMANPIRILAFGDSLTAGYGLSENEGFVPQLQSELLKMGREVEVINGGVSGDTTAGGLSRVDWMLVDKPDIVILELGANDMLRGLPALEAKNNLDAIIQKIRESGAKLLLAGMIAPKNMGEDYRKDFDAIYPDLAKRYDILLYPFFLDGIATRPEFNQSDGLHPTKDGVSVIVKNIIPYVEQLLGTP